MKRNRVDFETECKLIQERNRLFLENLEIEKPAPLPPKPRVLKRFSPSERIIEMTAASSRSRRDGTQPPVYFSSETDYGTKQKERKLGDIDFDSTLSTKLDGKLNPLRESQSSLHKFHLQIKSISKFNSSQLTLEPSSWQRLVPARICSLAFHQEELIVAVGDVFGNVGICDFGESSSKNFLSSKSGSKKVETHSAHPGYALHSIAFHPHKPMLLSAADDGVVRAMDVSSQLWKQVYASDEISAIRLEIQASSGLLLLGNTPLDGDFLLHDMRYSATAANSGTSILHNKRITNIRSHPTDCNIFATSSRDGCAKVWDIRMLQSGKASKPLYTAAHMKTITGVCWSPSGQCIATTSYDNTVSVWNVTKKSSSAIATFSHNNNTGRFLTSFQAVWHPSDEKVIMIGSLFRGIDILSIDTKKVSNIESDAASSITSLLACHKKHAALAATSASGRVYVWDLK